MPDTDATMSDAKPSDTNQLKRKSIGTSPGPDERGSGDVPIKRPKVGDISGRSPEPDEGAGRNGKGNGTTGNGINEKQEPATEDAYSKRESHSPDTRRAMRRDRPSPSDERRRHSETKRRDDRSPTGPPDRRTSGARRDSEVRSPPGRRGSQSGKRVSSFGAEKDHDRRESFSREEKKRGKRLFGGLLSTLSQTTTNSQQKRRQEIERRQKERAAQQTREDDKRRSEKLAKLERIRDIEQVRFDEQVVSAMRLAMIRNS